MGISLTMKRFLIGQTIFMITSAIIVGLIIKLCFPEHYFNWYPVIPVYFYIFGWFYIIIFDDCRKYSSQRMHTVYMGIKVAKMLISMFVLLLYVMLQKTHIHREDFVLTFFLFYIISLTYESYFFYVYERNKKRKKIINDK